MRFEPCEQRNLLAAINGVVYDDLTGNGLTPDDPPWTVPPQAAPITLNLFLDANNDRIPDPNELVASTTTDPATGAYEFLGLGTPGVTTNYILVQVSPDGAATTEGANPYFFSVVDDAVLTTGALVDDFDAPDPFDFYAIEALDVNPYLATTFDAQIMFGRRDLLVEVMGPPGLFSATGTIGTLNGIGEYAFQSTDSNGTVATLTYSGASAIDITAFGANRGFRLDFAGVQVPDDGPLGYRIDVTNPLLGTATFTGTVSSDEFVPFSAFIPFTQFGVPSAFFTNVDNVTMTFNTAAVPLIEFFVDSVVVGNSLAPDYAVTWLSKRLFIWGIGWEDDTTPPIPDGISESNLSTLQGTEGNDLFEFVAGETLDGAVVNVNGVAVSIDPSVDTLYFDGLGGEDTVILTGSNGDETVELWPDSGALIGENWAVNVTSVESIETDGLGGNDSATLYDSPGDDLFVTAPSYGQLTGEGFSLKVLSFNSVSAFASAGGHDVTRMYDSPGDDIFYATPIETTLYREGEGDGLFNRAKFFEEVHGFAPAGGYDIGMLFDSEGDDAFYASPAEGGMNGDGYLIRVKQFEEIHGDASLGGYDTAELFGSDGSDTFVGTPTHAEMSGIGYLNRAESFEVVEADASGTGDDRAWLFDSLGDDQFTAVRNSARLSFGVSDITAFDFGWVEASSTDGGNDTKEVEAIDFLLQFDGPWTNV